jgi:hypothetical protein
MAYQRHGEGSFDESVGPFEMGLEEIGTAVEVEHHIVPLSPGKICYKRRS